MKKMKLLVADDDIFFQRLIDGVLAPIYDLIVVQDGMEAWHELQRPQAPRMAVLDWVMPGLSGPQICRRVRATEHLSSTYLILLTARNNESDIIAGLLAGADDYITKPPLPAELGARIKMGERVLALQDAVKEQTSNGSSRIVSAAFPYDPLQQSLSSPRTISSVTAAAHDHSCLSDMESQDLVLRHKIQREARHSKH